jgi:hypothetical protein
MGNVPKSPGIAAQILWINPLATAGRAVIPKLLTASELSVGINGLQACNFRNPMLMIASASREAPCQIQSFTSKSAAAISPRLNRSSAVCSTGRLNRLAQRRRSTRADLSAATSPRWVTSRSAILLSTCRSMTFKLISTRRIHLVARRSCRRSIYQLEDSRGFRTPRETR